MLNILVINHDSILSGGTLSMIEWVNHVDFSKTNVFLLFPQKNEKIEDRLDKRIKVFYAYYSSCLKKDNASWFKNFIRKIRWSFFDFINKRKIKKICISNSVDIIVSNTFSIDIGAKISRDLNLPHIWHIREFVKEDHDCSFFDENSIKKLSKISNAIFISNVLQNKWEGIFPFKKSVVLHDYVDVSESVFENNRFNGDIVTLGIVGQVKENKGQFDLIRALEEMGGKVKEKKLKCIICGNGEQYDYLYKYVKNHRLDYIHFTGQITNVFEIRREFDIAIIASNCEAFGRVTIEAMSSGNLVIASNTGANMELIKDGVNGLLFETHDIFSLASKIELAVTNKQLSIEMINAAYDYVSKENKSISDKICNFAFEIKKIIKEE